MLSTLYAHAAVPDSDDELLRKLRSRLPRMIDDSTATMYRIAIGNDDGALYRLVIVFGEDQRERAVATLSLLGYRRSGPDPVRGLDAVFTKAAVGEKV